MQKLCQCSVSHATIGYMERAYSVHVTRNYIYIGYMERACSVHVTRNYRIHGAYMFSACHTQL